MAKTKFWTKKRIIITVIVCLVVAAVAVTAIVLGVKSAEPETALETVTRGSLQSSISSSGSVNETGVAIDVPLYAAVNGVTDSATIDNYRNEFSWTDFLVNSIFNSQTGNDLPALYYQISPADKALLNKTLKLNTNDDPVTLFTAAPVVLNVDSLKEAYQNLIDSGVMDEESNQITLLGFALSIFLEPGGSNETLPAELERFFTVDAANAVTVSTEYINEVVNENIGGSIGAEGIDYTLSDFRADEGEWYGVQTKIFAVDFTQFITSFTVNEYDVAKIDVRLRGGERVYAAISINALNGRKVLSEIVQITKGTSSGGVSYYGVVARIIFGEVVDDGAGSGKIMDFTYYDPALTTETVTALGIDPKDALTRDEVLIGYSVAVRVQQESVADTLIVPTKCIFYNDSNEPYVLVREGGRERRVQITITLSTGSDAAVTPKEGEELKEGDSIVYRADDSLLSSILG